MTAPGRIVDLVRASPDEICKLAAACEGLPGAPAWAEAHWLAFGKRFAYAGPGMGIWILRVGEHREASAWLAGSWSQEIAELEYLFVPPTLRRRGTARELLFNWFTWLGNRTVQEVQLEVRASNGEARALYESLGFREQGRRPGYYSRPVEDAILMHYLLPQHARSIG